MKAQKREYSANFVSLMHRNDVCDEVWDVVSPVGIRRIRKRSICEISLLICSLSCAVPKAMQMRSVEDNRKNDVMSLIVTSQRRLFVTQLNFRWQLAP